MPSTPSSASPEPCRSSEPTLAAPSEERPKQGIFNKEQITLLREHLPKYLAHAEYLRSKASGRQGTKGVKEEKRDWVLENVYPSYAAKFNSEGPSGPNINSLKEVSTLLCICFAIPILLRPEIIYLV